jgi:hypothetical protein
MEVKFVKKDVPTFVEDSESSDAISIIMSDGEYQWCTRILEEFNDMQQIIETRLQYGKSSNTFGNIQI